MSDTSDDMEFYSGFCDDEEDIDPVDLLLKVKRVVEYCEPHLDQMWAARITGTLLGCDFRDAKDYIGNFYHYCEDMGIK